ncbi:hypothetical protein LINGRAHAP2_LOCUS5691, partial [Linum grandiflorum]
PKSMAPPPRFCPGDNVFEAAGGIASDDVLEETAGFQAKVDRRRQIEGGSKAGIEGECETEVDQINRKGRWGCRRSAGFSDGGSERADECSRHRSKVDCRTSSVVY